MNITHWICCGAALLATSCGFKDVKNAAVAAPGTAPAARPADVGETPGATYASIYQNILAPKCVSCHGGPNPSHKLDLTTYDGLVHGPHTDVVVPQHPKQSTLFEEVSSNQMPPNGPPLSQAEIDLISAWISGGAQNN